MKSLFAAALAVGVALLSTAAPAQDRTHIVGTIESVDGQVLKIARDGDTEVTLTLNEGAAVVGVSKSDIAEVVSGSYVGIAATRQSDGSFAAREIHIFAEGMRGMGEGQQPMGDGATMTNGTTAEVTGTDAKSITVSFHGDKATIAVSPDTPVVALAPGDHSLLVTGAHIVAFGSEDGTDSYKAPFILVGRDGLVPPM